MRHGKNSGRKFCKCTPHHQCRAKNLRNNGKLQNDRVSGAWHALRAHWHRAVRSPLCRMFRHADWLLESSWNVMAHGDAGMGKWRGNWRMQWVASTLHTTSEHGVSSITTADVHTPVASSRLNWRPRRFKWTRPFRRKTKSGFCACAITFQMQSTYSCFWTNLYIQQSGYSWTAWTLQLGIDRVSRNVGN